MNNIVWERAAQFLKELRCEDIERSSNIKLPEYQLAIKEKGTYQKIYEQIVSGIKEADKDVIEKYVSIVEKCAEEENQQSYLQGMVDMILLLGGIGILRIPDDLIEKVKQWK